jgi:hypothetical protein
MPRPNTENPSKPKVNIAGDFSTNGTDITPDAINESDYATTSENFEARETIAPSDQAPLSPSDAEHMRTQREKTRLENLRASSQTQSTFGGQAGLRGKATDWPVDQ